MPSNVRKEGLEGALDALDMEVAILDADGTILLVNAAWWRFAAQNSPAGVSPSVGPGCNYLEVCRRSGAEEAAAGLASVLQGAPRYELEYPCHHSNGEERWFLLRASPLGRGAIVTHWDNTPRHHLEASLRERNEQLELALESARMGVWRADGELRRVSWFPGARAGLGVPELEGSLDSIQGRLHPEDQGHAQRALHRALKGEVCQHDFRLLGADGQVRWLTGVAGPRTDEDGRLRGVQGTVQDITERKTVELLLAGQNRILEMVAARTELSGVLEQIVTLLEEQVPGLMASVMLVDESGSYLTLGAPGSLPRGYCEKLGKVPIGPVAGSCGTAAYRREPVAVADLATHPLWAEYCALALEYGLRACYSWPLLAGGEGSPLLGTFAVYLKEANPVISLPQTIAAHVYACVHLAVVAIENEAAQTALTRSEARFRNVLDDSPSLVFLQDLQGQLLFLNRRAAHVLDLRDWLGRVPEEVVPAHQLVLFQRPLSEVQQGLGQVQLEESTVAPDGTEAAWQVSAFPLRDEEGKPYAVCVTATDITAQRESQRAHTRLEELYRRAQRMESVGQLAGGIAHDFNNLLTVINGYAECALEQLGADHGCAESMRSIRAAGERAASLTRQLLTFSRRAVVEPQATGLNEIIERSVQILGRLIGEDVRLETELQRELQSVLIDPGQAEQVIFNLAVNARDAMPTGGVLKFTTSHRTIDQPFPAVTGELAAGRYVQLEVMDSGEGMTPEVREHIFEPFFTTKPVGQGTGLGLATVYGVVRQAGGAVDVVSQLGKGTTFTVWLPALAGSGRVPESEGEKGRPNGHELILLVEDDSSVRRFTRLALERLGYRVLEADCGSAAGELMNSLRNPVDLVLTDVVMPNGGGAHVARLARERWPGIRILFTSGYLDDAVLRQGVEVAREAFLPKPFTIDALAQRVRAALDS